MRTEVQAIDRYSEARSHEDTKSAVARQGVSVRRNLGGAGHRVLRGSARAPRGVRMRLGIALATAIALAAGVLAVGGPASAASNNSAPGVSATAIKTGAISTLTGPIAANFSGLVPGIKAYFDMVNAKGGINGRKLELSYNLDDGGTPSQFNSQAHALVDQDHVFAVVGISSYWFTPGFFRESGIPTYGYNVSGNWSGPPNLYAAGGSILCYSCIVPGYSYLIKKTKSKSVALLAYNVSSSRDACATTGRLLKKAGVNVSYEDFNVPIDGNITPDIQRMQRAGSDLVLSCMDVNENVSMARAIQQYGLKVTQVWLNGDDQSVLNKYSKLMQGVYFAIQTVPFSAPTKYYPGLKTYLDAMKKYQPKYVGDSLAIQGWESASLFAAGVKAAGNNVTQQRVVSLTNKMTDFNADGLTTVTDWSNAHTTTTYPNCQAFIKVKGKKYVSVFGKGHQVFVCFAKGAVKNPKPVKPPAGTPGT